MMHLNEDHHVHSQHSDGQHTVLEMATTAAVRGMRELGFADHVRASSDWLDGYVADVRRVQAAVPQVALRAGVEAKILDVQGTLDLPDLPSGIDQVVIADHQFPWHGGTLKPKAVANALADGSMTRDGVLTILVQSTRAAVLRCPRPAIVGHFFSILPKIGIDLNEVDARVVDPLIEACLAKDARIEIDERWRAPSVAIAVRAHAAGVRIVASSDSHKRSTIGKYRYGREVSEALQCLALL